MAPLARGEENTVMRIGAARVDITPDYPIRLSGYGNRMTESDGVAQRIGAKALAIEYAAGEPAVVVSVENCGVPAVVVEVVAARLKEQAGIPRERLVVASTHTHTGPYLAGGIPFMFAQDPPPDHVEHIERYARELTDKIAAVAAEAVENLRPGQLFWAQGKVGFAVNRRVLSDGRWSGFGETPEGPVDHSLPVLVAKDAEGKVLAILANYACHCTTLGGDFNQICGDWAGYAQEYIEEDHPGAVSLISIGCGADANPTPRGKLEMCKAQGRDFADEVKRLAAGELKPLAGKLECKFDQTELPLGELPSREQWENEARQDNPAGRRARRFLEMLEEGKPLPTSIQYPVGVWTFGDDLAMVFLGGEVVVDYAIRMKEEFDGDRLWITSYANDVPCYIASKRILREGGYEVDSSMIYYGQPTRLAPEAEDIIIDAVKRLLPDRFFSAATQDEAPPPLSPEESLKAIVMRPGMKVELVAAEPLVVDPVAFDWGPDGRLWVVEMRDYPNGMDGQGKPGGRIKFLEDNDQDGRYDRATLFLDEIPFPTGVKVWREGVLVTAAPHVLFARDKDGDGRADSVDKLYTGFGEGNQQHRVNGLRWGLDNWLHVGNGDSNGEVKSNGAGKSINLGGRDARIRPDEGFIEATSGNTQFGRERDDWDNWFGGNNSNPMWHYVLEDRYVRRNPHVAPPGSRKQVSDQPGAAPVFPASRTAARFNDYNMANRFTSACSPIIYRDTLLGEEFYGNAFICEPVHNLVHREVVAADGATFTSRRAGDEQQSEFFASKDNWCRPVMVRTGPDGALWIADMYRLVIEHPTWIPEDWQRRIDVRAGDDRGRIYRVYTEDAPPRSLRRLDELDSRGLVAELENANGERRDLAHQMLLWANAKDAVAPLEQLAVRSERPQARAHALAVLDGLESLLATVLQSALADEHPGVRRLAARLAEPRLNVDPELASTVAGLAVDRDPSVRQQVAYSLGEWNHAESGRALAKIALADSGDVYITAALLSSVNESNLAVILEEVLAQESPPLTILKPLLATASALGEPNLIQRGLASVTADKGGRLSVAQMNALAGLLEAVDRRGLEAAGADAELGERLAAAFAVARRTALDESADLATRTGAVTLLGSGLGQADAASDTLGKLLVPRNSAELQSAAVAALSRLGAPNATKVLLSGWRSYSPAVRGQVLDALLGRTEWSRTLLGAVEKGEIPPSQIEARRRQQLLNSKNDSVRAAAQKLFADMDSSDRTKVVEEHRRAARLSGDAGRGKEVFKKRCAGCHRLENEGYGPGSDLTALTNKSPEALLIAILDPNRAVEDKFIDYIAVMNDGRQFNGILQEETGASITLAAADGKTQTILRKDLESLAATGKSLMPEGMDKDLTEEDLADVIAYVRTVGPPPKSFPGNKPEVVRVSINGRLQCLATNCRIYGPTLVFEEKYGNLGYWQSEEDRAEWTIESAQPGRYRVSLDYACPDDVAGDAYLLSVAGQELSGRVESTGSWDNYRSKAIGEIDLPAGSIELQFRSVGPLRTALIDLREIRLAPVE
jgi:putative membrane-bound dehydrogenase-like protein